MMNRFELINSIVDDINLTLSEKALLVALWRFSDTSGYSFPSVETLMTASSIGSKNTFIKARKSLVEKGYISYVTNRNKPCEYYIKIGSSEQSQFKNDSLKSIRFGGSKVNNEHINNITNKLHYDNMSDELLSYLNGGYLMEISSFWFDRKFKKML